MAIVVYPNGKTRNVQNLRWLINKAGKTLVTSFNVYPSPKPHTDLRILVRFEDNSWYATDYASYTVFCDWINRSRNLRGITVNLYYSYYDKGGFLKPFVTSKLPQHYAMLER